MGNVIDVMFKGFSDKEKSYISDYILKAYKGAKSSPVEYSTSFERWKKIKGNEKKTSQEFNSHIMKDFFEKKTGIGYDKFISKYVDKKNRKQAEDLVYVAALQLFAPYAKSASVTIPIPQIIMALDPFSAGAMREIVITKSLNSSGEYDVTYSSKDSGQVVTYDNNGKVIAQTGKGALPTLASHLYARGYNVRYLENPDVWFSRDINGKTPAESVTSTVIKCYTEHPEDTAVFEHDLKEKVTSKYKIDDSKIK